MEYYSLYLTVYKFAGNVTNQKNSAQSQQADNIHHSHSQAFLSMNRTTSDNDSKLFDAIAAQPSYAEDISISGYAAMQQRIDSFEKLGSLYRTILIDACNVAHM